MESGSMCDSSYKTGTSDLSIRRLLVDIAAAYGLVFTTGRVPGDVGQPTLKLGIVQTLGLPDGVGLIMS
eukprot:1140343-Pelagomonas_calceolata.AAC.1